MRALLSRSTKDAASGLVDALPHGDKPRLGIVLHDFTLGGTERIAVRLANCWASMGVPVDLFAGSLDGPLRQLLNASVTLTVSPAPIPRGRGSVGKLGVAAGAHFAKNPVTAIFVPGNYHWALIQPLLATIGNRRPQVIAQISAALHKPQRRGLRQWSFETRMRKKLRGVDHVVSLSDEATIDACRILGRDDVSTIALPALDDASAPLRALPDPAHPVVFAAARIVPGKGLETLVAAFADLRHPTARLVIAGSGPGERKLRLQIARLGIQDRVQLLGYVPCIRPWLDAASFLVLSSEHEGYGAVIVEALAAGRPVLATNCSPAIRELLDTEECGIVVPARHRKALASGMASMLRRQPVETAFLAARVTRFKINAVARSYLDLADMSPSDNGAAVRHLPSANNNRLRRRHFANAAIAS